MNILSPLSSTGGTPWMLVHQCHRGAVDYFIVDLAFIHGQLFLVTQHSETDSPTEALPHFSNAHGELLAAVYLVSLGQKLCFSYAVFSSKQVGKRAPQKSEGPEEAWHAWALSSQTGLGLEPVLCPGGIHGDGSTIHREGKPFACLISALNLILFTIWTKPWLFEGKKQRPLSGGIPEVWWKGLC